MHNSFIKRAEESKLDSVMSVAFPLSTAAAAVGGGELLDMRDKIDNIYVDTGMNNILRRAQAFKKQHPNISLDNYMTRAVSHLDKIEDQQKGLKKLFRGTNKYKAALALALAGTGAFAGDTLYDALKNLGKTIYIKSPGKTVYLKTE